MTSKPVRVLVANQPRLMRELLMATIADQPDIEVVGEIRSDGELEHAIEYMRPDFLIVALQDGDVLPKPYDVILRRHPYLKVIGIAPDRNSSTFYWASLNIHSNQIEASEEGVLNALRGRSSAARGRS